MEILVIAIFILGYLAITLEHQLHIDKLIPALIMMALCWAIVALGHLDVFEVDAALHKLIPTHTEEILLHHLGKTAEILVFLIGAMTIVEIIDYFNGFSAINKFIKTKSKRKLLWIFAIIAFCLSAIIDNLTATIVLISILRKIVNSNHDRLWYASFIVIAANSGGAWSPIGDVTTTMLWIANKVSTGELISNLFIPSVLSTFIPVLIASRFKVFQGNLETFELKAENENRFGGTMLIIGLAAIIFVPIFKTITHLPPYIGMMLSLAVVAIFAEIFSKYAFSLTTVKEIDHENPVHRSLGQDRDAQRSVFPGYTYGGCSPRINWSLISFCGRIGGTRSPIGYRNEGRFGTSDF